jgi:SAM-dependent methyltransferase
MSTIWKEGIRRRLEARYLAAADPRGQSGFWGDAAAWRQAREIVAERIDRDGTFLDVGCANGHLMECVVAWCGERGVRVEPYGLEILEPLAELARQRLPAWADRIYVGDAVDWSPPRRFDFVRTHLDVAPVAEWRRAVEHLGSAVVAPGGRLICCSYGSSEGADITQPVARLLREWGFEVGGEAHAVYGGGGVVTRLAWVDVPPAAAAAPAVSGPAAVPT